MMTQALLTVCTDRTSFIWSEHGFLIECPDQSVHLLAIHSGGKSSKVGETPVGSKVRVVCLIEFEAGDSLFLQHFVPVGKHLFRLVCGKIRYQPVPDKTVT